MAGQRNIARNEHTLNIRAGLPMMNTKYGLTMDEYDYIDIAIDTLRDIKHFGTSEYYSILTVGKDGIVLLPCNIYTIDAVVDRKMGMKAFKERQRYDIVNKTGSDVFYVAERVMKAIDHYYRPGLTNNYLGEGYITYNLIDDRHIQVSKDLEGKKIVVAFTGILVDDEGYPMITRKQANAIAAVCAKFVTIKRVNRNEKGAGNLLEYYMAEAGRLKQAASIPEDISDNEFDDLFDEMTTFNRKTYKRPTKYNR